MSMDQNKGSPHLSNLDQPDLATSTTSSPQPGFTIPYMSNMSAPNDYQYPAPPGHQGPTEPYRASPTSSAQNALNLPPMRLPPQQQQEAVQQQAPPAIAQMTAPRVPDHGITYWGNSGDQREAHMGIAPSTTVPPPIGYHAPRDLKMMSGGRHKKEIKRRTKTGCLTCRKRRIKCDEAHPVCRNCQKSKRECAGYDPVSYKIQLQPGPAAIQPAPSSNSPISQFPTTSSPFTPTPYAPALSTGNSSPGSSVEPYDYNSAIDPALDGIGAAPMSGPSNFENGSGFRPDMKAGPQNGSAPPSGLSNSQSVDDNNLLTRLTAYVNSAEFRSVNLTELLNSLPKLTQMAATQQTTFSEQDMESLKDNFVKEYAMHLNEFFSTKWYTEYGTKALMRDTALTHDALLLFKVMGPKNWREPAAEAEEIKLILRFMKLVTGMNGPKDGALEAQEVAKRVEVFERLVAGRRLSSNITAYTPTQGVELPQPDLRKLLFWNYLGHIVSADRGTPQSRDELARVLFSEKMRSLLESLQGRDVLYSIAIVGFDQKSTPEQIHLFNLAKRQIESTAKSVTEQTNPVATRICALAVKCFAAMHAGDSVPSNGTPDGAALEKKA